MSDLGMREIQSLLDNAEASFSDVALKMRIRRILISRDVGAGSHDQNYAGVNLPYPFNQTSLAIRTMTHYPSQAAQYYTSRITANRPEVTVIPVTQHTDVTKTVDKMAGEQERLTGELLDSAGLREFQREAGWAMSVGGAAFGVVMPRDADWGLPERRYYDITDTEIERLKHEGTITPVPRMLADGTLKYAERGDIWHARRRAAMGHRAINGNDLFTLRAWPRDQVLFENDRDSVRLGPKWVALVEEIPAYGVMEGSELARAAAKKRGVNKVGEYGLWIKDGHVVGGVSLGVPPNSDGYKRPEWFTLIRFYDRTEQVVIVAPMGSVRGGFEVYRGKHQCTVMGAPANPVVEMPFFRTDTNVPMQAYSTPIDSVMALAPLINQLMTLRSNAEAFNLIPRLVMELKDGTNLRGEDGQPQAVGTSEVVPGLDPSQIASYPGTVKQLLIDTANSDNLLKMYLEQMAQAMPSPAATGASGETTAWGTQIAVEQQQAILKEPVDNFTAAVRGIVWRMYGWLRMLDVPIQFHSAPNHRTDARTVRALTEFDPKDLTDSIVVEQDVDTPEEATVRKQVGLTLWQSGAINDEEFAGVYLKEQDPRAWRVNRLAQIILNYVAFGGVPPNVDPNLFAQSMLVQIANGVRGEIHYELLNSSPNYAWANATQVAEQANQQAMMQQQAQMQQPQPQQGLGGEITQASGARVPGVGMASTLGGQLGGNAPGIAGVGAQMAPAGMA